MEALFEEIESLEAILMDDVRVEKHPETGIPETVETTIFPLVGEEAEEQYVCVTLQVNLVAGYPEQRPTFRLKNSRGLCDSTLATMTRAMNLKLDENLGHPVVFDLIDVVREYLTERNLPSGQCVVCLYGFNEGDQFTKTPCYHYLHTYCLLRHLHASQHNYEEEFSKLPAWQQKIAKPYQAMCPVCRESIDYDVAALAEAEPPSELMNAPQFQLTTEIRDLQAKMAHLYLHQKNRGGIIDVDAEEPAVIAIDDGEDERERQRQEERRRRQLEAQPEEVKIELNAVKKAPKQHQRNHHHHQHHKKGQRHHFNHHHRSHGGHQETSGANANSGPSNR